MPLIRTDVRVLLIGAIIVALFSVEAIQTGFLMTARERSSLDAWVASVLAAGIVYAALFMLGHRGLRARRLRSRVAYAGLGSCAAIPAFMLVAGWQALAVTAHAGRLSALLACPLVVGALVGFLYHRRAGYDVEGDDVATLATSIEQSSTAIDTAHLATATAEYFAGPFVVKNSPGANGVASLLAASTFVLAGTFAAHADPYQTPLTEFMVHNGAGRTVLQGIAGMAVPIAGLLALTHAYLRSRGKHSYRDYALAGLVGPAILSLLIALTGMSWFALVYMAQFLAPSLVAVIVYRRLAGLEPAPLPEDIEVSDRRTLVGEDHVRRRMARIIAAER